MLASTHRQKVNVITETTQDIEVLVICSHTDQLVPAPLAAYELQHQKGLAEATGNTKGMRLGSAGSPSRALLRLAVDVSATIRPKDIDGPNVCAPVTQFDEERFLHFIQQHCTVHVHYFETNRTPRAATSDRLTSSSRRRHIAVLTDHMTQAQREALAMEIRNRIAAAHTNDKRVLDLSFFTKNPNANARGNEYLRSSVPNLSDIHTVTQMQSDYLQKCKNPYNYSKAEMLLDEAQQARSDKFLERQEAAMEGLGTVGTFEMRSNVPRSGNLTPRRVQPNTSNAQQTPAPIPPPGAPTARQPHPDESSDSDDDFTVPPAIANSPAFMRAIGASKGGSSGRGGIRVAESQIPSRDLLSNSTSKKPKDELNNTQLGGSLGSGSRRGINFNSTPDLQQKLAKADSVYAKEIAKASIAIVAEDMRRRGLVGPNASNPQNRSPLRSRDGQMSGNSSFAIGGGGGDVAFLPTLVDPNCALVMGQISAFTKGRFDKRTGAYIGGGGVSMSKFAGSEGADHAATGRRRSLFLKSGTSSDSKGEDPSVETHPIIKANHHEKPEEVPKHAKFLYSRTGFAGSVGAANSHSSNILLNIYLFNALFEQVNGHDSLIAPSVLSDHNGNTIGSPRVGPMRANADSLTDASNPLTPATKKALLYRLLDNFQSSVIQGTLQHSAVLAALLEANEVSGKPAAAAGALANINTVVTDLNLADFLVVLLTPLPIALERCVGSSSRTPKRQHSRGEVSKMASTAGNKDSRSWLHTEPPASNVLSSTALRLSPRKAEALATSIDMFAVKGPQSSIIEEVERRGSTLPSPRRPIAPQTVLSPLRQKLQDATTGKEANQNTLNSDSNAPSSSTRIPRPPNVNTATNSVALSTHSLNSSLTQGTIHPSIEMSSPRIPYSSSYPDHVIGAIIDRTASASGSRKKLPKSQEPIQESISILEAKRQFDAETVSLVRPFDQFFRIFDPDLTGTVRRDGFILALTAAAAANNDSAATSSSSQVPKMSSREGSRRTSPTRDTPGATFGAPVMYRQDAKSAVYYTTLWMIAVLFQQPATSDEVKLGEIFALRDCLRNVHLREQRLVEADKALQRLKQAIKLLTPREGGPSSTTTTHSRPGTDDTQGLISPTGKGQADRDWSTQDGTYQSNVLLCLERAAEHGIDSHQVASYGELGRALTEALAADMY